MSPKPMTTASPKVASDTNTAAIHLHVGPTLIHTVRAP